MSFIMEWFLYYIWKMSVLHEAKMGRPLKILCSCSVNISPLRFFSWNQYGFSRGKILLPISRSPWALRVQKEIVFWIEYKIDVIYKCQNQDCSEIMLENHNPKHTEVLSVALPSIKRNKCRWQSRRYHRSPLQNCTAWGYILCSPALQVEI